MPELIKKEDVVKKLASKKSHPWSNHSDKDALVSELMHEVRHMTPVFIGIGSLADTVELMNSEDYKNRFRAEYAQLKIRYEKLKAYNNKIEAAERTAYGSTKSVEMPPHDCPMELLREQQHAMEHYLHCLEVRAVIEDIKL